MKRMLFIIYIFILIGLILYMCLRIFYQKRLDEATISWKKGDIHYAIIQYEKIPSFIYPIVNNNLFEIYANRKYKMNNIQKAFSYIENYSCKEQKVLINSAFNYYELSNQDKDYLINKLLDCL